MALSAPKPQELRVRMGDVAATLPPPAHWMERRLTYVYWRYTPAGVPTEWSEAHILGDGGSTLCGMAAFQAEHYTRGKAMTTTHRQRIAHLTRCGKCHNACVKAVTDLADYYGVKMRNMMQHAIHREEHRALVSAFLGAADDEPQHD